MLLDAVNIDATVERRDRNWLIRIYSELERQGDVGIECHREVVLVKDGQKWDTGGTHGERKYMFTRKLSEILNDTVTLPPMAGGITLTAGQIALALEMLSDKYADIPVEPEEPSSSSSSGG